MFIYPENQDAREIHTSVHPKVDGWEHADEVELRNRGGSACSTMPQTTVVESAAPENLAAAVEAV